MRAAEAHPDKQVALWFMDEARVGQKGRTGHRWWIKGQRPPGLAAAVRAAADAHPDKQIALWFMDEARVGQKGRTTHRWWVKGQRPPGVSDKRFESAYIFAAVRPSTGDDFALVLPRVSAKAMSTFLAEFAKTIPDHMHAVMVLDGAGWHDARALNVPEAVTLVPLPPYRPELNPVERV